jgi:hypothetical protein
MGTLADHINPCNKRPHFDNDMPVINYNPKIALGRVALVEQGIAEMALVEKAPSKVSPGTKRINEHAILAKKSPKEAAMEDASFGIVGPIACLSFTSDGVHKGSNRIDSAVGAYTGERILLYFLRRTWTSLTKRRRLSTRICCAISLAFTRPCWRSIKMALTSFPCTQ